jgi:drug/metabolite transporter (DMT)-like permease
LAFQPSAVSRIIFNSVQFKYFIKKEKAMNVATVYASVILIWSTTPLGIRFSVESLDFVQALAIRMWISLLICWLLIKVFSLTFKWSRPAFLGYFAGSVAITGAMLCVYWAALTLPSGLIAVLWGISPLVISLYSRWLLPNSGLDARRITSILLAVLGLYIIFAQGIDVSGDMVAALLVLILGINLHGISSVMLQHQQLVKGYSPVHPVVQTTGALLISAPVYAVLWWAFSPPIPNDVSVRSMFAIGYLAVFGSVLGFVGYFYLMNRMSAANVSLITLITPVLALILGAYLADEKLELQTLAGTVVIMWALIIYHLQHVRFMLGKILRYCLNKS